MIKNAKIRLIVLLCFAFVQTTIFASENEPNLFAVYLTWQGDPSTTMTVQWITNPGDDRNEVYFAEEESPHWLMAKGSSFLLPKSEAFAIHRIELAGLKAGKSYLFKVGGRDTIYKFRTMPDTLERPVNFVVGGDMYNKSMATVIETNRQAAKTNPMFVLIGGDIAYIAERHQKYNKDEPKRWIAWFKAWHDHMKTPDGHLIPFLPAIGNHEVYGFFNQPKEHASSFYALFPFPGKQGYNILDFGSYMSIALLDSGHTNFIGGEQAHWLYHALEKRAAIPHKFAIYHVPAFPSVRKSTGIINTLIRQNWVPIFEHFSLSTAFENHDHAYKRSHPIRGGRADPAGVLYLGDGSWGIKNVNKPKKPEQVWYLAKSARTRQFILVTVEKGKTMYKAISPKGEIIDFYLQEPAAQPAEKLVETR